MNIDYEPEPDPDDQRDAEIFDQMQAEYEERSERRDAGL